MLNLTNADAVRAAAADILARARKLVRRRGSPVSSCRRWWCGEGARTDLGLADDPTFGTVIVFGRGGTAVEMINDKALALPPLDLNWPAT